jgi:antitoxin (DNA-binding transcriptional repressor) of toxin-antitoxin stability system
MTDKQVRSDEARRNLRDLLDEVALGARITILRYDKPAAMLVPVDRLTAAERDTVARARVLAGTPPDGNRAYTGTGDDVTATAYALGQAKDLLGAMAAIVNRLDGHG